MATIWTEDFEDAAGATSQIGVTRQAPNHGSVNGSNDGDGDYSGRTNAAAPFNGVDAFTNHEGNHYWTAEDLDSLTSDAPGIPGTHTDTLQ